MTLLDRIRNARPYLDRWEGVRPEWVRRMLEGKLPVKEYTWAK